MVRYREGHRERTRGTIIDAASQIMRDRGFQDASVGEVMKAAGLTHGGFYAHFPDKTAMLVAAVEEAFVESPQNFTFLANLARTKGDNGLIAKHYLADSRVENVKRGCPAAALLSETPRQDPAIRTAFQAGAEATMRALATAPGLSPAEQGQAWAALAMLIGGLSIMRAVTDREIAAEIREQIIAAMQKISQAPDGAYPGGTSQP